MFHHLRNLRDDPFPCEKSNGTWMSGDIVFVPVPREHFTELAAMFYILAQLEMRCCRYAVIPHVMLSGQKTIKHENHMSVLDCSGDHRAALDEIRNTRADLHKMHNTHNVSFYEIGPMVDRCNRYDNRMNHVIRPAMSLIGLCASKLMEMDSCGRMARTYLSPGALSTWEQMGHRIDPIVLQKIEVSKITPSS